ncbi:MAG TPA: ferredoxin [Anaerolineaceae bacterium]|nr:ferredoxin [Anaerolineaceae bacterium]
MKVRVDQDLCIGCGICEGAVPEVFSLENGTTAEVIVEEVPKKLKDEVRQTSKDCPVEAILVEDDEMAEKPAKSKKDNLQKVEALKETKTEKAADEKPADKNKKEKGNEMKVTVDKDLCIGCGVCEGICPEVFSLANEPYAEVLLDPIPAEFQELCRQAAGDCPVEAIKVED